MENSMSMSPLVTKLKAALASVGVATSNTQDAVLMAATTYISTIAKPEKGDWIAPPPIIATVSPQQVISAVAEALEADKVATAKPKAKKKAATRVGR